MTQKFEVFSRDIISQIKDFIESNHKQTEANASIIAAIRELSDEKDCPDEVLIERASEKVDDPIIGKALQELIRANESIIEENSINEYEESFLIKVKTVLSNSYYFYPHLDVDMNALFDMNALLSSTTIASKVDKNNVESLFMDSAIAMEKAFDIIHEKKEDGCCPAREDNTQPEEEAIVEEVIEDEPVVEDSSEESVTEEVDDNTTVTEEEAVVVEEPAIKDDTSEDYVRMLPLGFKAFDGSVFGLEKEYAFRSDNVVMDLTTNTIINVSRRNGEFVFLLERQTIPLSTIRAFVQGVGNEDVEEPVVEDDSPTTNPVYKYIDWIEGIPKTKYRISSRGVFNTISESWVHPFLNMSGNETYSLTSTTGKSGERTSKQNKPKRITKKKLYQQAGMIPE